MPVFYDQLRREVTLPAIPQRIISVAPSQTELLFYLGLDQRVTGITKFCVHPADKFNSTTKIGGTKQLDIEKIKQLNPDLIIANKEENERGQIEELMKLFPVWISDISSLIEAVDMIERVGALVGKADEALSLSNKITRQFNNIIIAPGRQRVAYFIWRKPYMVAGTGTFINDMLEKCGLVNAFEIDRYPEVNATALAAANPDIIFLSSEPYPFKEKHCAEFKTICPQAKVILVDGEYFSWYGNRLLDAPGYFGGLRLSR
jgi:ABC-type Fe3+-hydroxamate transport system substrate-binding protein